MVQAIQFILRIHGKLLDRAEYPLHLRGRRISSWIQGASQIDNPVNELGYEKRAASPTPRKP
ncbi:MAG: hypothetical protein ACI8W7_001845 [Gammaproteobacteria bacterium]|jgi:hypothetical protein